MCLALDVIKQNENSNTGVVPAYQLILFKGSKHKVSYSVASLNAYLYGERRPSFQVQVRRPGRTRCLTYPAYDVLELRPLVQGPDTWPKTDPLNFPV